MKALLIDVAAREIRAVEYADTKDLRRLVDGSIASAWSSKDGEVVYVDDDGLFRAQKGFFRIAGVEQPFAGNGVLVGPERYDDEGEYLRTDDPVLTPELLGALVQFMSRAQVDSWAKANASEPSGTFTDLDTGETLVFGRFGELFANMPREEGE